MSDTMTTPQRSVPPLERPIDGRVMAGVAAGIARRLEVGTGWIRVGFVVLSFFGGLGILLYIVGWLAIRGEGEQSPIAERWVGSLEDTTGWIGLGLMVAAGMIILAATDIVRAELVLAAGLFLAGVLLYRGRLGPADTEGRGATRPPAEPGEAPNVAPAATTAETPAPAAAAHPPAPGIPVSPPPPPTFVPPPPPPLRPRSYLGRFVVAAGLIVIGALALFDNLDILDPDFRHYVAAGMFVIGAGLLVGAFFGRARGLIALGLIATPLLLVSAAIKVPLSGEYGEQTFRPLTAAEVQPEYELSGGALLVDLRDLDDVSTIPGPVKVSLGIGELTVWLPPGIDVEIMGDVGIGALNLLGDESGGLGIDERTTRVAADGVPDLVLDLEVGIGNLQVFGTP